MTYRPASVLDALVKPIEGTYGVSLAPGSISVALFDTNGAPYAQATAVLPADLLAMTEAERMAKITGAAQRAARLINAWGKLAKDTAIALGVPVVLDPETVIEEDL